MSGKSRKAGIIVQVAALFAVGVLTAGSTTYYLTKKHTDENVTTEVETFADEIGDETIAAVKEYPAYKWLLEYWYENADILDIEYDAGYGSGEKTRDKYRQWISLYPDLPLKYVTTEQIEALSPEDQKLYAEIAYSWLITRLDDIKQSYRIEFLYCVIPDETFTTQNFLFSAADPDSVRGTEYEQVYPIGTVVSVAEYEDIQESMRGALEDDSYLADAGKYVDYYKFLDMVGDRPALIGMTYNLSELKARIDSQTRMESAYSIGHLLGLGLVCLCLLSLFVLNPLRDVQKNIRQYKETKESGPVIESLDKIRPKNEIGDLSEDVAGLVKEMDDYINQVQTITAERERMGTELMLAARIQENMLPSEFPDRPDFEIYASMDPAKQVGGDFYDFFMIDDDHLALVIADVSGKGIPASLFMMGSIILIHTAASSELSPGVILKQVNEQIYKYNKADMFVTVWLGILDLKTGVITAANAGHEYPILQEAGGHFEVVKDKHGFVIGVMEGMEYKEYEIVMKPGSRLFVYTDGVPEATTADNELFGIERTVEALRTAENGSPKDVLDAVNAQINAFVGEAEQFDDLTMMCICYTGPASEEKTA